MQEKTINHESETDATYGFWSEEEPLLELPSGLNPSLVRQLSSAKEESSWMLQFRLKALQVFESMEIPSWGPKIDIDFNALHYYSRSSQNEADSWENVPQEIKETFDKLGIPEAERRHLAGLGAQYDSEMVYHKLHEDLKAQGVIFCSPEEAVRDHRELFQRYFSTVVPITDNKFAALNSAVWSGGSFVYVPPAVHIAIPLQAYFRINSRRFGQFERTLIIADEGSFVHYVEGCTAPNFSSQSLHSAVVEIIALKGARVRYSTVQNWSRNVYNLVTKRARAHRDAVVEWVDGNIGACLTMKYPSVILAEEGAHAEVLSIAFSKDGQIQDAGAKMIHLASHTSSMVTSKSISKGTGCSSYRGQIYVDSGLHHVRSKVECDALLLDPTSRTCTYPVMNILSPDVSIEHEATVSRVSADKLYYLMSRGLDETEARTMIVNGFIDPLVKELPMEFAIEFNRLIQLEMEGSVG